MYSGYKSFIRYNICQYFLPACSWSWNSITISFEEQKFSILMKSRLSIGPFIDHAFSVVSKRCLPKSRSQNFSPMFYLRSFIVLAFIFTFIIYFCVIFCVLFKHGPKIFFFFFCTRLSNCSSAIYWKSDSFSTELSLHLCRQLVANIFVG